MSRLDDVPPFLSPQQAKSLHRTIDQGWKTAKIFMREDPEVPGPMITIFRTPKGGGPPVEYGSFEPIMVNFGLRETSLSDGTPISRAHGDGDMRHEVDAFDLRVGDIFFWYGKKCIVAAVYPPEFGVVTSEIELQQ